MATSSTARAINEAHILRILFESGPLSRAEIARRSGLTKSAMTSVVGDLVRSGLMMEAETPAAPTGAVGRPGTELALDPLGAVGLGAEVRSGEVVLHALDLCGNLLNDAATRPVDTTYPQQVASAVAALVDSFVDESLPANKRISGLCVAVPGQVTLEGEVAHAFGLGWVNVPFQQLLVDLLDIDVRVENNANVSAFAEWYLPPRQERHDLLLVSLTDGVGAGLISQGRIMKGYHGMAGEVGHMILEDQPLGAFSTRPISWEVGIGTRALLEAYKEKIGQEVTIAGLTQAALDGEVHATVISSEWARWVARGLLALIYAYDPERIVIGGELAPLFECKQDEILENIERSLVRGFPAPTLRTSKFGTHIASIGAAATVHFESLGARYSSTRSLSFTA